MEVVAGGFNNSLVSGLTVLLAVVRRKRMIRNVMIDFKVPEILVSSVITGSYG